MRRLEAMQVLAKVVRDAIARQAGYNQFGRLEDSFRFLANSKSVRIWSIYYWTRFVNDGRSAISFSPDSRRQMVFYRDPADDPRLARDYPKTQSGRRKLTAAEFRRDREAGLLIVTRSVAATQGKHFIEDGIREARDLVPKKFMDLIRGDVRKLIRRKRDKITVGI